MYDSIVNLSKLFVKLADDVTVAPGRVAPQKDEPQMAELSPEDYQRLFQQSSSFNFDEFSKLDDPAEVLRYADRNLRPVGSGKELESSETRLEGQGSGRMVYELDPKRVLKIAINESGIAQNNNEARIAQSSPLLAEVLDMHPRSLWIVSEKVSPFSPDEFREHTGIPLQEMRQDPEAKEVFERWTPDGLYYLKNKYNLSENAVKFLQEMSQIISNLKVIRGDLTDPVHWGLGQDGRVKVYDYGLDSTMHKTYYEETGDPREQEYYAPMQKIEAISKRFIRRLASQ